VTTGKAGRPGDEHGHRETNSVESPRGPLDRGGR
jgi:hypothetical protein